MRWEDERYVRLYTRDTTTWKLLCWQSKCLLPLLLRKLDRAGLIDVGDNAIEGVAALTDMPVALVQEGLVGLLQRGVFELHQGVLIMPNYQAAQEARQSDAQRMREYRGRARDRAREALQNVTPPLHVVTPGDTALHPVTPSLAVPSLAFSEPTDLRSKGSGNSKDKHIGEGLGGATDAPLRLPPKTGTQIELVPDCQPAKARKRPTAARHAPVRGAAGPTLPPWLPERSWADWCAFRLKKSGKGWTERAAELSLRKLAALRDQGHDPTAVIEQSIERGWTGLFELKDAGSTKEQRYYSDVDEDPPRRATTTEGPSGIASIVADLFEEGT